jgi:exopolysaccharide biosynthesis WecB/TagA/CpsF family protein
LNMAGLMGFPLLSGSSAVVAEYITSLFDVPSDLPHVICHINANNFERIVDNNPLRDQMARDTLMIFDGIGLKLAYAWLKHKWISDTNGTDIFPLAMERLLAREPSLYLLGGKEGVSAAAAVAITRQWNLRVVGQRNGYFGVEMEAEICEQINRSSAQILLVGLGCPLQEEFALRNRHRLRVRMIWVVGGLFDFLAGILPRAPRWVRHARLEWLFRWAVQPRTKAYRTWVLYPRFVGRVALAKLTAVGSSKKSVQTGTELRALTSKAPMLEKEARISLQSAARVRATELLAYHYNDRTDFLYQVEC